MKVKFGNWKSCATENPTKDGDYLVIGFYEGAICYGAVLHYSTEYGWNVHIDENGVAHTENRIDFSNDTRSGSRLWCDATEFEGDAE
jgi:hypothetical protein